ncbi:MAG: CofH family radical SAM protein [Candidatus Thalassarchaeaceae archaeon]|jgi:cyclic dehypoxanthinyl futalosine synthase|nr:CofH family radical SAM protein [Candidatus Thalassarchaeaceae archaeon]MDP6845047.1 CofH family radical SAM protein [Candidatus Thalassarchaeaceae archaeon]
MWQDILDAQRGPCPPRLSIEDATILYEEADFNMLRSAALERRRAVNSGNHVTYMIDRNVNYTNICTINCQFCSFYRPPGHSETYTQTYEEISARFSELEVVEGVRVLMQGGVNPELPLVWYTDLIEFLRKEHPSIALDCFSPIEIEGIADICNLSTLDVLKALKDAGMHGLPGGGAEMLVDDVRLDISPKKGSADNWLRVMHEAQSLGLTTSATNVIGFGENAMHRVKHMSRVRDLQDQAISKGWVGFTSFVSWPVQLETNVFGKRNHGRNRIELGAGPTEYLRHVAISRLFFDNIDHIQGSWPTMGLDVAQMALFGGADDIGSTMMEENVVSASGTDKTCALEVELQETIRRAGFVALRRDSDYNLLETPDVAPDVQAFPAPPPLQPATNTPS